MVARGIPAVVVTFDPKYRNWAGFVAMLVGAVVSIWLFSNQAQYVGMVPTALPEIGDITFEVGFLLAFSGVVGLWGIGYFSYDLLRTVFDKTGLTAGEKTLWVGLASLLQNIGGLAGVYAFTHVTQRIGRRPAFASSDGPPAATR